ncbi:hypothetical protein F5Y05DRAFT_246291 [Hypoxylon sp. FL0543]|nr:hypothetical protein F5Y05DRAFT_246291 [Hypoxylon sp. FL0543]
MQQKKLIRLSTRTQGQPHRSSNQYGPPPNGYSQHLQPLPAAYGYLPQESWSQGERRLISEGPHAVPMRMQRAAMNETKTHPMPIPSLQLSTDRPYSVPTYLDHRARSENGASLPRPPRPVSSSDVDSIRRLVTSRSVLFPPQRITQKAGDDSLTLHSINSVDAVQPMKIPRIPRAVANRGPKTSPNDSSREGDHTGLGLALFPPEQNSSEVVRGQKRATELTAMKYFPSKRININVTLTQSETPVSSEAYSAMNTHMRDTQVKKDKYTKDSITEKEISETLEEDDNSTQGYDSEDEVTEAVLKSKRLRQAGEASTHKSDQDLITGKLGSFEGLQGARDSDKALEPATAQINNVSNDIPTSSNAELEILDGKGRNEIITHRRYTNAWNQCDIDLEATPSAIHIEPKGISPGTHRQPPSLTRSTTSDRGATEGEANGKTLASRLSRIEEVTNIQKEKGMDKFIKSRLYSGDPNLLETLTGEILLGMVAHDDELLQRVVEIMQVPCGSSEQSTSRR